ncbi:unnamed protein product [Paramecium sonneborni]|uniref:Pyridine nucleotide-disulfide oxidoreductase n=1 Tax=Paramecium sonneborni TaxID=65129 RepID=A0A8S1PVC0_9CILI|nr:unnamed protein product [Paramecium sonneborni]
MNFKFTVIGAGPAGIITVCQLLKNNLTSIAWVDPQFNCGALNQFTHIPSNTKIQLFLNTLKNMGWVENHKEIDDPAEIFKNFDPNTTCELGLSYEMFKKVMVILDQTCKGRIVKMESVVEKIENLEHTNKITLKNNCQFESEYVFHCTGSKRNTIDSVDGSLFKVYPHLKEIDLYDAMSPEDVHQHITNEDTVCIFGNSHSGILAAMNLYNSPNRPKHIYIFQRRPIILAEYLADGKIMNDSTGLKGRVAEWAKNILIGQKPKCISEIDSAEYKNYLQLCTKVVVATGFQRNTLPIIQINDMELIDNKIHYDDENMTLVYGGREISNNFGFGIAFPEKVLDANGSYQHAVGFYKFMLTITKVITKLQN